MEILTPTRGAHTQPIDPKTRLAHDPDGQEQGGEALDKRQQPQAPDQVLRTLVRLDERHQQSAAAVQAFVRNGTPQQLQDVADSAVAVGQQAHLRDAALREFAVFGFVDTPGARRLADDTLAQLRQLEIPPPLTQEVLNQPNSSEDFFAQLLAMIGQIRGEYLAVYEELLKKYSDFYGEFNKEIMAEMSKWIAGSSDGKTVTIKTGLYFALEALLTKYSAQPTGVLFPIPDKDGKLPPATEADAKKWAEAMGMGKDSPNVKPDGKGGFVVMMDLSPLKTMADSVFRLIHVPNPGGPGGVKDAKLDSAKFQAWQTGFNSQEGELKNQLQVFTTKYGNANSYHENFNKILSSQLSMYAEMLSSILKALN